MKITRFETFLTNAGLRNYLFMRLTTDTGLDRHRRGHARMAGKDGRRRCCTNGSKAASWAAIRSTSRRLSAT